MSNRPNSIDVIIPVHNAELYIKEALGSVINQTYPVNKIYLIDDGSNDRSEKIINEYQKESSIKIEYIKTYGNSPSKARNIGIKRSSADIIAFLDADDVWHPEKIEKQIKLIEEKEVEFVHTGYQYIDSAGNDFIPRDRSYSDSELYGDVSRLIFHKVGSIALPSVIISKKLIDRVGAFDPELRFAEDHDLWIRAAQATKFGFLKENLLKVRRHNSNITNDRDSLLTNRINFYTKWATFFPANTPTVKDIRDEIAYKLYKNNNFRHDLYPTIPHTALRRLFPFTHKHPNLIIIGHLPVIARAWIIKNLGL